VHISYNSESEVILNDILGALDLVVCNPMSDFQQHSGFIFTYL